MFRSADKLSAPSVGDPGTEAAQLLFIRVICQAVEDHGRPSRRAEVDAFFNGPVFARYCGFLGWNRDWATGRIQRYVAGSARRPGGENGRGARETNTRFDFSLTRPLAS
jgi:hypothetical protein